MGKLDQISQKEQDFIANQKMFFVATAPNSGSINLSPKGIDSFRVIDANHVIWLNLTGSGNETQAHVDENGRMTIMFCSFEGPPNILRLYGKAEAILPSNENWNEYISLFPAVSGSRQILSLKVDLVQNSCGFGVPFYEYKGDRDTLEMWANKKGAEGIREYKELKNTTSLDGKSIRID
ncbi:MAG: pyridoxamine 5'-phosphate oxidase [Crocinitomicaceae bacterium]|nr:pyridoxamine 5'-phosphate oxidase [Crocinitomicaceae bacterium]|tara:strand:+ start:256732 stop:257268 length:537 start_codon:yes stop_codon:yes gene_type:complete